MKQPAIVDLISTVIKSARTGDYGNTSAQFNIVLQQIQQSIKGGLITKDTIGKLSYSLETLFEMQKMENWVAFADILEYEIIPLWKNIKR